MKKLLLILMVLASAAMAGDRQMKALLVGTWIGDYHCRGKTFTFQSGGTWQIDTVLYDEGDPEKWDIKGGKLILIQSDPKSADSYTILLLTEHEFVARGDSNSTGYLFLTR